MDQLFLHPPFDAPDLLASILGPAPAPLIRSALLPGHAVRSDAASLRIALIAETEAAVAGHLLSPTPQARSRLDFAMATLGAAPERVIVETAGGAVPVLAYRFPEDAPGEVWAAQDCDSERRARLAEALIEVMGHYPQRTADEMRRLLPGIGVRALARARGPSTEVLSRLGSGLAAADVEPEAREFSYARFFAMEEHRLRHRRFDGRMSSVVDRAVFTSGDAVTVLPFDPRAATVLLIEQFRAAPYARKDPRPWCLEAVAGRCDRPEPPEATARREAREEAGLELGRLECIGGYYASPGSVAEYITSYVGEADLTGAGGSHGLVEEDEDIRTFVVPLAMAMAGLAAGEIRNAPLMLSLYWLERNADRIRTAWT